MGIKGWLAIGAGVVVTIAVALGIRREEDQHDERIKKMINDVDLSPEEEPKPIAVKELIDDAKESAKQQKDCEADADSAAIKVVDNSEILEAAKQRKENEEKLQELRDKANDPEWQAEQERLRQEDEQKKEALWKRKVKKAVEQKNFSALEDLFDQKYAGGPWHPSPASVFGEAHKNGDIPDGFLELASEHFGKLWFYSGD